MSPAIQAPAVKPAEPPKKTGSLGTNSGLAKLIVELPADAKLYVDDQLMKTASERRVFSTPQLADGQAYYYMLRAEVVRDGQKVSKTKQVIVRAGEMVQTTFPELQAPSAVNNVASAGH